jgi:hypothetical protein
MHKPSTQEGLWQEGSTLELGGNPHHLGREKPGSQLKRLSPNYIVTYSVKGIKTAGFVIFCF